MKVALIVPRSPFLFDPLTFPPLGIMYLSSYLKQRGHTVTVYDYNDFDELLHRERWANVVVADAVGITGVTPQFKDMVQLLGWARYGSENRKYVVAGGPHASCDPDSCLGAGFDCAVIGDGEYAFERAITEHLVGKHFAPVENLDMLPFPDREAIDIKKYHYQIDGVPATSIITQRGCPYQCAFCCHWQGYRKVRFRSPENVVAEIEYLKKFHGYHAFMFWDDEFNLNRNRTIELCEALKPMKVKWRCFIRADLFDAELADTMNDGGCVEVGCGVESGSQRILNNINKQVTVEQTSRARKIAKVAGIRFKAFLMIANSGDDEETVEETRDWLRKNEPDDFDITINTPYPGSPEWEHPENYDLIFDKNQLKQRFYEGLFYKGPQESPVRTKALSEERIVQLRDEIEDEFHRKTKSRDLWTKGKDIP